MDLQLLQRVLHRQRVDHRRQHPHVIAGHPIDEPFGRSRQAAVDVAPADDHGDLHAHLVDLADLLGDRADGLELEAEGLRPHEGFAGQLQEDSAVLRLLGHGSFRRRGAIP